MKWRLWRASSDVPTQTRLWRRSPAAPTAAPVEATPARSANLGWRLPAGSVTLPEVHGSIEIPARASFWRKLFAFAGPGYLVAVGYMDPGYWATDLAGGARYGYTLLSVIMLSNLMAILLQALALRDRKSTRL